jgi:hypothetical protein
MTAGDLTERRPADPSGGGEPAGPDARAPINKSSLLLAGLLATGVVAVYVLSTQDGPSEAAAGQDSTETQVDSALSHLASSAEARRLLAKKDQENIDIFYYEARQRQIPLNELHSNPFVHVDPPPAEPVAKPEAPAGPPKPPLEATRRLAEALAEVEKLTLQTVLMGRRPTAMINNNLLTEGQRIRGWTVAGIRPKEVTLTWNEHTHVLKLR